MRAYPRNGPAAAARIVALFVIADGHVCCSEINALTRCDIARELGLMSGEFPSILKDLCEDHLLEAGWAPIGLRQIDESILAAVLAEVDDPVLQGKVLHLALAVALADRHLDEAEIDLLKITLKHWPRVGASLGAPVLG